MQHQIQQFKDEITQKEKVYATEHFEYTAISKDLKKAKKDLEDWKDKHGNIEKRKQVLDRQIEKMRFMFAEAESERSRLKKDYE